MTIFVYRRLAKNVLWVAALYVVSAAHRAPPTKSSIAFVAVLNWKQTWVHVPSEIVLLVAVTLLSSGSGVIGLPHAQHAIALHDNA